MRVLNVISALNQGGMETVVTNYFDNMDQSVIAYDFLVIWSVPECFWEKYLISKGCRIFKLQYVPRQVFKHGREVKDFFAKNKYDVVVIHATSSLRYTIAKIAKKNGVKHIVYYSHTSSNKTGKFLHKLFQNKLNKWCDYKFACSEAAGKYMYNRDFKIINNAVDVAQFSYNENYRTELRSKYSINHDTSVIGYVARLASSKNHEFLINVAKSLNTMTNNFKFLFVGDGDEKEKLIQKIEQFGLSERIELCGAVGDKVNEYYSAFDVVAFPSKFEGLSVALVEAQANGLPIVASNTISKEHKLSDKFEFMSIENSEENYYKWAETLLAMSGKRERNVHLAEKGFDIAVEARKLQDFYLNL